MRTSLAVSVFASALLLLSLPGCRSDSDTPRDTPRTAASTATQADRAQESTPAVPDSIRPIRAVDLSALAWLEGTWRGTGGEMERPFFERFRPHGDSLLTFTVFADAALSDTSYAGHIRLRPDASVIYRTGADRWIASAINDTSVQFSPYRNVSNRFVWTRRGPNAWTADLQYASRTVTYRLTRVENTDR